MMSSNEKEFSKEMLLVQAYADGEELSSAEVRQVEDELLLQPEYKNFFDEIKVLDQKLKDIDGIKPSNELIRNVQEILVTEKIPEKKKFKKVSYTKYVAAAAMLLLVLNFNSLYTMLFDLHGASSLDKIYIKQHLAITKQVSSDVTPLNFDETKSWLNENLSFVPNVPEWELFEIKGKDARKINKQDAACIILSNNSNLATLFILNSQDNAPYTGNFVNKKYDYFATTNYQICVWAENEQEYILVANYEMGDLEYMLGFYDQKENP